MCFKIKLLLVWVLFHHFSNAQLPSGFTVLNNQIPELEVELRYATSKNFMGRQVKGYYSDIAIGSIALAKQLKKAQAELKPMGFGIKIFDAYRPQTAVNDFIKWSEISNDTISKKEYYPDLKKNTLFELGFIAKKSGHSRGSTVDLTLIYLGEEKKGEELDMGSSWDFFGDISNYDSQKINEIQKLNRKLLRDVMISNGFIPYEKEWWHFTLINEPFPNTYYDFSIITP
ncbi:MAG: peptidase M15 [Flavobacteriaceae bacterium]|nr:peptidase M15 [Flavobacteriaceae bacterium]|tara:strand:+ start:3722 stop:4408 length:687 start_codon:yes stop_codon:yes gene_type:complete